MSFAQERLWFLEQLGGLGAAYHLPWGIRLWGPVDAGALRRALDGLVARHEALRTTVVAVAGVPTQRVVPAGESRFALVEQDIRGWGAPEAVEAELQRLATAEARAPFDLATGPLVRGRLIRLAEAEHVLLVTLHHIVSDGWSMGVLLNEVSALYGAFVRGEADPLPPLAVQYADYAVWQRRWVAGEVQQQQAAYWQETLRGAPEQLALPTDHPRPATQDHAGAQVPVVLEAELTAGLQALSRRQGTTLFQTLLAGWAVVLSRLAGQEDVVIGTPTANRGRTEIEGLIGFFVNTLALRIDLTEHPTGEQVLARVKARALEAQQQQDLPFEQVVELVQPSRSLAHHPLFQVLFAWQNAPRGQLALPGLTVAPLEASPHVTAKFDLSLSLAEAGGRIVGGLEYATALWERATVERYVGYLRTVLAGMVADEQQAVAQLPLLSAAERDQVVEAWNATAAPYPEAMCVHELVEAQAAQTPDAVAVVYEDQQLPYGELNARANQLAHHLRALGVGPETRVALCLERSLELVVGILGVLKAGGAYVPLDPSYPAERLRFLVDDSAPAVLLTQGGMAAGVADASLPVLDLTADAALWAAQPTSNPPRAGLTSGHLAYVIYTSGSTGQPKGVLITHRNVVRLVVNNGYAVLTAGDRVAFTADPAFDAATFEVWGPLLAGARMVVIDQATLLEPARVAGVVKEQGVTVLHLPTALFNQCAALVPAAFTGLRHLLTGGDRGDGQAMGRVLQLGTPERL
ncbi:MAG: non-ribosomal peptide synthetase, partial [Luteibacter jiangsuensis]